MGVKFWDPAVEIAHRGRHDPLRRRAARSPINGTAYADPVALVLEANAIGGRHGLGMSDQIENRIIEAKSRGIYEAPGMALLYIAYERLLNAIHNEDTLANYHARGPAPRPAALRGPLARPAGADAARVDPALGRLAGHRRGDAAAAPRRGLLDPRTTGPAFSYHPDKLSMERTENAAFGPTDRIGQLTMRNLDIADSRAKLEQYAAQPLDQGHGPGRERHPVRRARARRLRPDRRQPRADGDADDEAPRHAAHRGRDRLMARRGATRRARPTRAALWAAGSAGGPSPELEALSRSTHFDWRLDALRPGRLARPRQRAARRRAAHRRRPRRAARAGSTRWRSGTPRARCTPTPPTRTSTARSSGCCSRRSAPTWAAACAPVARRNDQVATLFKAFLRDHARDRRRTGARPRRRPRRRRPATTSTWSCRGAPTCSTPSRCCCRTTCSPTPGRCSATSTGCADWDARVAADSPYGSGALAGSSLGLDPEAVAARARASPARAPTRSTARPRATSSPSSPSSTAMIGVDVSRLAEEVILWSTARVRLRPARRRLVDRVEHHAAEEEPRHRRAGPRQGRPPDRQPRRPAGHAQGPAAGLQPRPAGGQGAGLRLRRHPRGRCSRRSPGWSPR